MKKGIFLIMAVVFSIGFSSCEKTDPQYTLEGKWKGTFTANGGNNPLYFQMNFKAGGALDVETTDVSRPEYATGTYTLVGDSVKGSYTYTVGIGVIYNFSGKYASSSNVVNGTIGINPSYIDNATFSVTKQ